MENAHHLLALLGLSRRLFQSRSNSSSQLLVGSWLSPKAKVHTREN